MLVFMTSLLAFVYEKVIFFGQLEADGCENIDSFSGGLWAVHRAADLPMTNKEQLCFSVLLHHFMNNFLIEIVV